MKWEFIHRLSDEEFRRLTGVKRITFEKMLELLRDSHQHKKSRGGRPNKLSVETMLLMMLEYLREYRTYFHVANSYGVSEGYAYKIIRWVEDTLIKAEIFHLPGRKALLKSDIEYEVVLVDASETPIERPKKNRKNITQEKRKGIR
jgi:Helix-turn-helix of DDE superfamily endonuclease